MSPDVEGLVPEPAHLLLHGKYRLVRLIGKGGFGTVYEARDERGAGNRVAVKVVNPEYSSDPRLVRAFRAEARRMTRLSHPNIVDWKNFDADEQGLCYFVMELVEGEELDKVLARKGPLPHDRAARILLQILDALRAAHHHAEGGSVLHLDLKPRNVFLLPPRSGRDEQVKVIDFGIGQHVGDDADDPGVLPGGVSKLETSAFSDFNPTTLRFHDAAFQDPPGMRRCQGCTPEYASPEQAAHVLGMPEIVALDGRSDLYSLGVMAFQMLTGELPFARPVLRTDYLRLHLSGQPRKIAATSVKVPRSLARFVERCLAKDRDARFRDANEAYGALERIVHPPVLLRALVGGAVLVAAAFAFGAWLTRGDARGQVLAAAAGELKPVRTLVLGPEQIAQRLAFEPRDLVAPGAELRVVRTADGAELAGARVSVPEAGALELALDPSFGAGRVQTAVRVEGAGARFEDFELLWLGPDAWKLARVAAGGADLVGHRRTIDPRGLDCVVDIEGEGRGDVERVWIAAGPSSELELVASGASAGRRSFRATLDALASAEGSAWTLHARDRAGRTRSETLAVDVVVADLGAAAELCASVANGPCAPVAQLAGRRLLGPGARPILRARSARPARVEWRTLVDGTSAVAGWERAGTGTAQDLELATPQLAAGNTRVTGVFEVAFDERELVTHAANSGRGRVELRLPFEVTDDQAGFTAQVVQAAGRVIEVEGPETIWLGADGGWLVLRRTGRHPMQVVLSDGRTQELSERRDEARFALDAASDGERALGVEAFRLDGPGGRRADRPDTVLDLRLGVDRAAPAIVLAEGLSGATFHDARALRARLAEVRVSAGGAPSFLDVRIEHGAGSAHLRRVEPARVDAALTVLDEAREGTVQIALAAEDEAGNRSPALELRCVLALAPPEVALEEPRPGTWRREGREWAVQFRAQDANGLADVRCRVVAADGTELAVELAPGVGTGEERQYAGRVAFPHAWSEQQVQLVVDARDGAELATTREFSGFVLPAIEPPKPAVVRALDARGGRLRLVEGNAGGQYLFGGRGDDVENAEHRRAGLPAFAPAGSTRSWSVPCAAGEIGDFYVDEREVTRGEFLAFVRARDGFADARCWPADGRKATAERRIELERALADSTDLPVTGVTWDEAAAFAHWAGRRLPTWVELEYAARGGPSHYRPFAGFHAKAPAASDVNTKGLGPGAPWKAGAGRDATPDTQIVDLAGNVSEWTSTPIALIGDPLPANLAEYFRAKRVELLRPAQGGDEFWIAGGSFALENFHFDAARKRPRSFRTEDVGFRCALSLDAARAALEDGRLREDSP